MPPEELEKALTEVYRKGFYNADSHNCYFRQLLANESNVDAVTLKPREKDIAITNFVAGTSPI